MSKKVIIESVGTLKNRIIEGVALTPAVSLNRNIYSIEAIDSAKNLGIPLKADWEHTDEIVGSVTYEKGPNHTILYKAQLTTDRVITEGLHKVSIEASVDDVVSSCNKKGCFNLLDGITFEGIGITTNPGVQTTTLNIVESYQEWKPITNHVCENCMGDCLKAKSDKGIEIDDQAKAICASECGLNESEKIENLEKTVEELKNTINKITTCDKCHKPKKL